MAGVNKPIHTIQCMHNGLHKQSHRSQDQYLSSGLTAKIAWSVVSFSEKNLKHCLHIHKNLQCLSLCEVNNNTVSSVGHLLQR